MLDPSQFHVGETWIVFKLNDVPVSTEVDGDFNVFALMDVASRFILGTEFVSANSLEPSQLESKRLLKGGRTRSQKFPKKLLVSVDQRVDILGREAEGSGITLVRVSEEQLLVFVGEARQGFREHMGGGRVQ